MLADMTIKLFLNRAKVSRRDGDIQEARELTAHAARAFILYRYGRIIEISEITRGLDRIHSS